MLALVALRCHLAVDEEAALGIRDLSDRQSCLGKRKSHYPTQAKVRLGPDFLPRCAREVRVCAFH
jgi:hypothetical protein